MGWISDNFRSGLCLISILLAVASASVTSNVSDPFFWGPYRPNLYFGLRPRLPQSLMTGLVWFGTQDYQSFSSARHACEQGDGLDGYTWTEFDAQTGGRQVIKDGKNNVKITTEFLKVPGGNHGGSWAARIKGSPINHDIPSHTSFVFYLGMEGIGGLEMESDEDENGLEGEVKITGSSPELDDFRVRIVDGPSNTAVTGGPFVDQFSNRIEKTHFAGLLVPAGNIWQAKEVIQQNIVKRAQESLAPFSDASRGYPHPSHVLQLSDEVYTNSNLFAVQKSFDGEFQFDVFFESASQGRKLSASVLDEGISSLEAVYDEKFHNVFPISQSYPYSKDLQQFSKAITANLFGGVGYFYGTSIVNRAFSFEWDEDDDTAASTKEDKPRGNNLEGAGLTEPKALLTATPSRSFFPRGFYWDEGFHLLHIGQFDNDFSLQILKSWIDLIDEDGWVAREQILGEEARSKVPKEFQAQIPNYANPPTLTIAVTSFIARLRAQHSGPSDMDLGLDYASQIPLFAGNQSTTSSRYLNSPELAIDYLKSIYGPLKRHYDWFRRTQRGQIKQYGRTARSRTEAYRWRGRSEQHVLTSGMDDYPRGPPHAGELHLDLISWMAFFSRTMRDISEFVGEREDAETFKEIELAILDNIEDLHWSEKNQMYCDASIDEDDESYHVCHKGYLSLFPFLLSLLPPSSPHLGAILDLVQSPDHLWSPYGIRSLSIEHPEFGQGENYWKGPIWIQMNYLALSALHKTYTVVEGPYQSQAQEIYKDLRNNIINNVFKEYQRTGYVWEQYDSQTGEGRRSHPFTGWTSLVTLILAERY